MPSHENRSESWAELAPFEWYMLQDDRPEYPMSFSLHVVLSGQMRRETLDVALARTLERHPLFAMRARHVAGSRWEWTPIEEGHRYIHWRAEGEPLGVLADEWIDITKAPGLRIWAREDEDSTEVRFLFQHCCCDGVGAMQFLADLFHAYAHRAAGRTDDPFPAPLDVDALARRGTFHASPGKKSGGVAARVKAIGSWVFLWPSGMQCPDGVDASPPERPLFANLCSVALPTDRTSELLGIARSHNVTLNDLMICSLFRAVVDWDRRRGRSPDRRWLRISVPVNLREEGDERMPSANRVAMSFISRRARRAEDANELLASVRREMGEIKETRRGVVLLSMFAKLRKYLGFLPFIRGDHCFATSVLSNLGRLETYFDDRFARKDDRVLIGEHALKQVVFVPPFRIATQSTIGVHSYGGELTFGLRCNPHRFSPEHAREFLDMFLEALDEWRA